MKLYHGTGVKDFNPEKHINSRYGFQALFFTDKIQIAELYAKHHKEQNKKKEGYVYEIDFFDFDKIIEYNYELSYSGSFRRLIIDLHKQNYNSVFIKNVTDYPSTKLITYLSSNILVLYNIDLIKKILLNKTV